jgi:hypothetical protein
MCRQLNKGHVDDNRLKDIKFKIIYTKHLNNFIVIFDSNFI